MDPLTAEKIVNAYGKVLEQVSHMSFGAPESLLPYKKEIIKEAIKMSLDIIEPEDQEIGENLRVGYMELARFIPDEEAEITSKDQIFLMSLISLKFGCNFWPVKYFILFKRSGNLCQSSLNSPS